MIRTRVGVIGSVAIDRELPRMLGHGFGARAERWVLKRALWPALFSKQVLASLEVVEIAGRRAGATGDESGSGAAWR
jgi:hypothetical protein